MCWHSISWHDTSEKANDLCVQSGLFNFYYNRIKYILIYRNVSNNITYVNIEQARNAINSDYNSVDHSSPDKQKRHSIIIIIIVQP